jgi:hypothetical protein
MVHRKSPARIPDIFNPTDDGDSGPDGELVPSGTN